ncbi:hypothetical protein [Coralliovum pocilloporae]|uniref:hypothetical protein n=1 Tax=Coralliovum pocilloporae TaxID=3066369 RepID=UPI00330797AF
MRSLRTGLLLVLLTSPALADERAAFYGTWGTEKQCARAPIKPGGTVLSEPFRIDPLWLRQGTLWCSLRWGPVEARGDGLFTGAHVQCGEDSVRGYFLGMDLSGKELTLRWDFPLANGPLHRCTGDRVKAD